MEIKKLDGVKTKCSIAGCNNLADYTISLKRGLFRGYTDICHSCLNELYTQCGHFVIPQSPPNMLRKKEI